MPKEPFAVISTNETFDDSDVFDVLYGLYDNADKQKDKEIERQHLERCEINKQAIKQSKFVEKYFHPYQPAKQTFNPDKFPSLDY